ncbi:uncharacterized protein LOC130415896 isoform X2 [Triplophysa dalaica]|uniref:uncharacterized protein LOC130415896 isoform X2 n=1 Tax=Triplophysa dalaica TaxID=1582913 RepID=UPI0024DFA851|nr:uncharacterized protein LOC130415896 isoform X2 [Triplophysa dalaica]
MEKLFFFCVLYGCLVHITYSGQEVSNLILDHLGETVTLNCNMTNRYEIAWYHLNSEQLLTLLVSAQKDRTLLINYNTNPRLTVNRDSSITLVSLVISEVTQSDLGLYFCGTKSDTPEMHFNRAVRLQTSENLMRREENGDSVRKHGGEEVETTDDDDLTVKERVLMFGGVGLAIVIFFLATVAAGGIIHHHGWQKGWSEGKDAIALSSD